MKRSQDWTFRLQQELLNNNGVALFVTLTYEDSQLNFKDDYPVLCKRDIQLFHKRLRHVIDKKLNYFLIGEYGPTTLRPHYHGIYFGLDYSYHKDILQSWDKGYVSDSLVTDGRIAYVAKYSLLPANIPEKLMSDDVKPFMICSKGMGISFLQSPQVHNSFNASDELLINDHGYKKSLPRYYRDKLFSEDKRHQFALEYYQKSKEELQGILELQKNNPQEYERIKKVKLDWIHSHRYDVENRLLKKPKI